VPWVLKEVASLAVTSAKTGTLSNWGTGDARHLHAKVSKMYGNKFHLIGLAIMDSTAPIGSDKERGCGIIK